MDYTLNDKIEILNLSDERVSYLNKIKIEDADFPDRINKCSLEFIDLNNLVGTTRNFKGLTWLELLGDFCHKPRTIENFRNKESYKIFIESTNIYIDYPEVLKKEGKYYIAGNGLHRLTIAKCLGLEKALCVVCEE